MMIYYHLMFPLVFNEFSISVLVKIIANKIEWPSSCKNRFNCFNYYHEWKIVNYSGTNKIVFFPQVIE